MWRRMHTLAIVGALGLGEVVAVQFYGFTNPVLGALFVLALPGFAIASAVFDLSAGHIGELILLSVGLSISADIVGGLLINLTPWGLTTASWGVMLGSITLCGAAIAMLRSWLSRTVYTPESAIARSHSSGSLRDMYFASPLARAMVVVTILAIAGAFTISLLATQSTPTPGFTQLWMLPPSNSTSYVQIGVRNEEHVTEHYILNLSAEFITTYTWTDITLAPGQSWTVTATLPTQVTNSKVQIPVQATLYLADAPNQPYRQTQIWVGSAGNT